GVRYAEGWACDPDFPTASIPVQLTWGAPLGAEGSVMLTGVADGPLAPGWREIVNAECGGGERHGFHIALPSQATSVYAYGIDLNVPGAPFSLLRGGKKIVAGVSPTRTRGAVFTGWVEPPASGTYTFSVDAGPTDKFRLWVNGMFMAGNWNDAD